MQKRMTDERNLPLVKPSGQTSVLNREYARFGLRCRNWRSAVMSVGVWNS